MFCQLCDHCEWSEEGASLRVLQREVSEGCLWDGWIDGWIDDDYILFGDDFLCACSMYALHAVMLRSNLHATSGVQ